MKKRLFSAIFFAFLASAGTLSAQILLSLSNTPPNCQGAADGTASVTATGGNAPYQYVWSNGQTSATATGLSAGTYTVTVSDANGQTAIGATVLQDALILNIAISSQGIGCDAASGTLTATGFGGTAPYTFAWDSPSGPASGETVAVSGAGTYSVTLTDAHNCTASSAYSVAQPLTVAVTAVDIACADAPNSGAVNSSVQGGLAPLSYFWSNGSTTAQLTNVGPNSYTLLVTGANGCTAGATDVVDITTALKVKLEWLVPACNGSNGAAIVSASGGTAPYTFTWTGGLTGASQSGLAPGTYEVTVNDTNGCEGNLSVTVPATAGLNVQLVLGPTPCVGVNTGTAAALVLPGGNYTYLWHNGETTVQIDSLAANTTVSVTVTDPATGCTGTATGIIGAHTTFDLNVEANNIPCPGEYGTAQAVALGGTPAYQYTWMTSDSIVIGNEANIDSLIAGAYIISVTDAVGCEAVGVANIGVNSAPEAQIQGGHVVICGDSLSTVAFTNASTDPFNQIVQIEWTVVSPSLDTVVIQQQNQITFSLTVDEDIWVQLVVTSGSGCVDTAVLLYNVPGFPSIDVGLDSSSLNCFQDTVALVVNGAQPGYSYQWQPAVIFNPDPVHVLVVPTAPTLYTVTVTDGGACTTVDSILVLPGSDYFFISVEDTIVHTCDATATLFATSSYPATIVWTDPNGNIIPGNPVTVPATSDSLVYTVTAISADSCIRSAQVTVISDSMVLVIDPMIPTVGCEGSNIPLGVIVTPPGGNLTYQWSVDLPATLTNANTPNPTLFGPAGLHTVQVFVSNGFCEDSISYRVEVHPSDSLDGRIWADLCDGKVVSFFNDSGMEGVWAFGDGDTSLEQNPVHTYAVAGEYMVTFTPVLLDCIAPWDSMLDVQHAPLEAAASSEYMDCANKALIKFAGSSNFDPEDIASWNWSFPGGIPASSSDQNPVITFTQEGLITATLVVTDKNHCIDTVRVEVMVDIINDSLIDHLQICLGEAVQLNANGFDPDADYNWGSNPLDSTLVNPNDPNPTVSPDENTVYTVQAHQGLCTEDFAVAVTVITGPDVDLPNDTFTCSNALYSITAITTPASGVEWSTSPVFANIFSDSMTVQVPPVQNGVYYVRTNSICPDVDSIHLDLNMVDINAAPNNPIICLGEETQLVVTSFNSGDTLHYDWTPDLPDIANPNVAPVENTTYTVIVTNEYGCTATAEMSVVVNWTAVQAEVVGPDTITPPQKAHLLATPGGNGTVFTFSWSPAETLSNPNSAETDAAPETTQIYTVTVTSDNGCTATDEVEVFVRQNYCIEPFIFIPKAFTPNDDQLNDLFRVRGDGITELKFIIWNRWGEIVYETNDVADPGWDGSYKGKNLTPDAYAWYVWCRCGDGEIFERKGNVTLLK